mmetsp:Transcript_11245/g.30677  ORF Transcript_11245/g.30677 Transcript_11245/m.30677 type:complete len:146 (+) Transcript_11245:102-539(+)
MMERGRAGQDRGAPAGQSPSVGSTALGRGPLAGSVPARRAPRTLPSAARVQATLQDKSSRPSGSSSAVGVSPEARAATSNATCPSPSGVGSGSYVSSPEAPPPTSVVHVPHPPVTRPGIDGLVPAGALIRTTSLQQRQQQQQQQQ